MDLLMVSLGSRLISNDVHGQPVRSHEHSMPNGVKAALRDIQRIALVEIGGSMQA